VNIVLITCDFVTACGYVNDFDDSSPLPKVKICIKITLF